MNPTVEIFHDLSAYYNILLRRIIRIIRFQQDHTLCSCFQPSSVAIMFVYNLENLLSFFHEKMEASKLIGLSGLF